jgi:hypothetical protein
VRGRGRESPGEFLRRFEEEEEERERPTREEGTDRDGEEAEVVSEDAAPHRTGKEGRGKRKGGIARLTDIDHEITTNRANAEKRREDSQEVAKKPTKMRDTRIDDVGFIDAELRRVRIVFLGTHPRVMHRKWRNGDGGKVVRGKGDCLKLRGRTQITQPRAI